MSQELSPFLIRPNSLSESMELSRMIANSNFCPKDMKGKPGDVIMALQMGSEVGLSPMQALQNIAVINGKPCLYGDGALAVVMGSPNYEYHKEWEEGSIAHRTLIAYCLIKRKGSEEYTKHFSIDDATKAGLWGKSGPWSQYPNRMLQMRARAFAIRDKFADSLRGIAVREEVEDYQVIEKQKPKTTPRQVEVIDSSPESVTPTKLTVEQYQEIIDNCITLEELRTAYQAAFREYKDDILLNNITEAKDLKKKLIEDWKITEAEILPVETAAE